LLFKSKKGEVKIGSEFLDEGNGEEFLAQLLKKVYGINV
jgi:hypothetical protein